MTFNKVCIVGMGYIGLPTAAVIANSGIQVVGVDVNPNVVDTINEGKVHIIEPGLSNLVKTVVSNGKLKASLHTEIADAFLIAVPTPFTSKYDDIPVPDLTYVYSACEAISNVLKSGDLIILESTSPVGTTIDICKHLSQLRPDLKFPSNDSTPNDIAVAYCPERVLPGKTLAELVSNDRIVGGVSNSCAKKATELYSCFLNGKCHKTDSKTAEMAKLTENASRDVQIAFANELSLICDESDINVWELISLANKHPRVNILQPGPGVGGHCIAVDPWFIVSQSQNAIIIKTAREINDRKPSSVLKKIDDSIREILDEKIKSESEIIVSFLGLAFKPNIDDLRESPAVKIVENFINTNACSSIIYEPNIECLPGNLKKNAVLRDIKDGLKRSDIVVALVAHDQFKSVDFDNLDCEYFIDTCGLRYFD